MYIKTYCLSLFERVYYKLTLLFFWSSKYENKPVGDWISAPSNIQQFVNVIRDVRLQKSRENE